MAANLSQPTLDELAERSRRARRDRERAEREQNVLAPDAITEDALFELAEEKIVAQKRAVLRQRKQGDGVGRG